MEFGFYMHSDDGLTTEYGTYDESGKRTRIDTIHYSDGTRRDSALEDDRLETFLAEQMASRKFRQITLSGSYLCEDGEPNILEMVKTPWWMFWRKWFP